MPGPLINSMQSKLFGRPPLHVLLAEDNPGDVLLMREALTSRFPEVDVSVQPDGELMMQWIDRLDGGNAPRPHVILLDLNLPRVSGEEILWRLRRSQACQGVPTIVVTSSNSSRDEKTMARLGADRYFRKPTDFGEFMKLGDVVATLLAISGEAVKREHSRTPPAAPQRTASKPGASRPTSAKHGRVEYISMPPSSTPGRVMVVDDDQRERLDLVKIVASLGYHPEAAADGEEALEILGTTPVDVIVTDLMMPRMDGFTLLKSLLERGDLTPAVVLTGFANIREALAIVHDLRAYWFMEKPAQRAVLAPLLDRAIRHKRVMAEAELLRRQLSREGYLGDLVGTSEPMQQVFSLIQQAAPSSASVLISGESGTGKERAAAAIHRLSPRAAGPFVAINCSAVPESLMESELFGHEKGAFTGAVGRQTGCIEQSDHGTLFLAEIAEMPMPMQAKLLRVLEDSRVRRLGGHGEISVDVRVLAATNRPVEEALEKKMLREDLYYRLNVFSIAMPPLRHRKEDILPITETLIRALNKRNDCRVTDLKPEVLGLLMGYSWPGNVRELRNVLERAVIVAREGSLLPSHLPPGFGLSREPFPMPAGASTFKFDPGRPLHEVEEAYIRLTLDHTNNNRTRTAEILGISLRTLYKRLSEYAVADAKLRAAARLASSTGTRG